MSRRPASGIPAKRTSAHGPDCTLGPAGGPCTRCAGFERGNVVALRHGGYAVVSLAPRVAEIADQIQEVVPVGSPADEIADRL